MMSLFIFSPFIPIFFLLIIMHIWNIYIIIFYWNIFYLFFYTSLLWFLLTQTERDVSFPCFFFHFFFYNLYYLAKQMLLFCDWSSFVPFLIFACLILAQNFYQLYNIKINEIPWFDIIFKGPGIFLWRCQWILPFNLKKEITKVMNANFHKT